MDVNSVESTIRIQYPQSLKPRRPKPKPIQRTEDGSWAIGPGARMVAEVNPASPNGEPMYLLHFPVYGKVPDPQEFGDGARVLTKTISTSSSELPMYLLQVPIRPEYLPPASSNRAPMEPGEDGGRTKPGPARSTSEIEEKDSISEPEPMRQNVSPQYHEPPTSSGGRQPGRLSRARAKPTPSSLLIPIEISQAPSNQGKGFVPNPGRYSFRRRQPLPVVEVEEEEKEESETNAEQEEEGEDPLQGCIPENPYGSYENWPKGIRDLLDNAPAVKKLMLEAYELEETNESSASTETQKSPSQAEQPCASVVSEEHMTENLLMLRQVVPEQHGIHGFNAYVLLMMEYCKGYIDKDRFETRTRIFLDVHEDAEEELFWVIEQDVRNLLIEAGEMDGI